LISKFNEIAVHAKMIKCAVIFACCLESVSGAEVSQTPITRYLVEQHCTHRVSMKVESQISHVTENRILGDEVVETVLFRDDYRIDTESWHRSHDDQRRLLQRFRRIVIDDACLWYRAQNDDLPGAAVLSADHGEVYSAIWLGAALDGYFPGSDGKSVAELITLPASRTSVVGEDMVNTERCHIISSDSSYGRITLKLCDRQGCIPLEVSYEKRSTDCWADESPLNTILYDGTLISSWKAVLSDVFVAVVDGAYFPLDGTLRVQWELTDGRTVIKQAKYVRSNVDLLPNFGRAERAFVFDLPEGSPVRNELTKDNGDCEWRRGAIVSYGSRDDHQSKFYGFLSPMNLLIGLNVILAVLALRRFGKTLFSPPA
jgi:hypothetical protein